jgi:hypothetical protein
MSNLYTDALATTLAVVGLMGTTPAWGRSGVPLQAESVEEVMGTLIADALASDVQIDGASLQRCLRN